MKSRKHKSSKFKVKPNKRKNTTKKKGGSAARVRLRLGRFAAGGNNDEKNVAPPDPHVEESDLQAIFEHGVDKADKKEMEAAFKKRYRSGIAGYLVGKASDDYFFRERVGMVKKGVQVAGGTILVIGLLGGLVAILVTHQF
jgi:hypothetical protein